MIQPRELPDIAGERRTADMAFDLPNGGVRIRVRANEGTRHRLPAAVSAAGVLAALVLAAYVPLSPTWFDAALLAASGMGLFACARRRTEALLFFDRAGIYDALARRPPIPWWRMERIDVRQGASGTPECLVACLSPADGVRRVVLPATAPDGLPVPFEYLVLQLHRRGAPIRRPDPGFDPFDCDARWLSPERAADLIVERLGERARPYAGTHLDIAETRCDRAAFEHWMTVVALLRQRAGLVEAAED